MKNTLNIFHQVLFLDLQPFKQRKIHDFWFREREIELELTDYQFPQLWEYDFFQPFSFKLKYYRKIIFNESREYFNELCWRIKLSVDDTQNAFLVHECLDIHIPEKLKQLAGELNRLCYISVPVKPNPGVRAEDQCFAEENYIFQLLKTELICLYLNISSLYGRYLDQKPYCEKDLYYVFFGELIPEPPLLKRAEVQQPALLHDMKTENTAFAVIRDDIRFRETTRLNYSCIRNPESFSRVEEQLFDYGIIDSNYCFVPNKGKGHHNLLAAVFRKLIDLKYFTSRVFPENIEMKDQFVREYLDARYKVNTEQQFRKLKLPHLENALRKLPWLDRLKLLP